MSETTMKPRVAVLMGSRSDWPVMQRTVQTLTELEIGCEAKVISAHRKAARLVEYLHDAQDRGIELFIAGAGGAAHLPGVIAGHALGRPVIGVPMKTSFMGGLDSLLSIVQMPRGIVTATVSVGEAGAVNAAILAGQMLGISDGTIRERVTAYRRKMAEALSEDPEET